MYKRPSYEIKTSGVYVFKTKDAEYTFSSYLFERKDDSKDELEINDELRKEIGSIIINNSAWKNLYSGKTINAESGSGEKGKLTRIDDVVNSSKYDVGTKRMFKDGGSVSKHIGFEALAKRVAERYKGKKVKPKYQKEYGKTYSKEEAEEVGNKVAGKMKAQMMEEGGEISPKGWAKINDTLWDRDEIMVIDESKFGGKSEFSVENNSTKEVKAFKDKKEAYKYAVEKSSMPDGTKILFLYLLGYDKESFKIHKSHEMGEKSTFESFKKLMDKVLENSNMFDSKKTFAEGGDIKSKKIKLIVVDENTLAYINPSSPDKFSVLNALITKGSNFNNLQTYSLSQADTYRLASKKDFDDLKVEFEGYDNDSLYEYDQKDSYESGGNIKSDYKIVDGFDHYKNRPLYHVIYVGDNEDIEYDGEWHTDREDAEKELKGLTETYAEGGEIEDKDWDVVVKKNKDSNWETKNKYRLTLKEAEELMSDLEKSGLYYSVDSRLRSRYFAEGGEIEKTKSDIAKLQKIAYSTSPMIPDYTKEDAKAKIKILEAKLHESKESKSEAKKEDKSITKEELVSEFEKRGEGKFSKQSVKDFKSDADKYTTAINYILDKGFTKEEAFDIYLGFAPKCDAEFELTGHLYDYTLEGVKRYVDMISEAKEKGVFEAGFKYLQFAKGELEKLGLKSIGLIEFDDTNYKGEKTISKRECYVSDSCKTIMFFEEDRVGDGGYSGLYSFDEKEGMKIIKGLLDNPKNYVKDIDVYYNNKIYMDEKLIEETLKKCAKKEEPKKDFKHTYMMLDRLRSDNEAFLYGSRNESQLWAGNVKDQISEMKKLWNELPKDGKPEWLSMEDIENYEKKMSSEPKSDTTAKKEVSFNKTLKFRKGDLVYNVSEKEYGIVLDNYGDSEDGNRGEIRLDSSGNTSIFKYNKDYSKEIGYNLVPFGSKEDVGKESLDSIKKKSKMVIDSVSDKKDKERYEDIYNKLLSGYYDRFKTKSDTRAKKEPKASVKGISAKFEIGDHVYVNYGEEKGKDGVIEKVYTHEIYPKSVSASDIPYYEIKGIGKEISQNNIQLLEKPKGKASKFDYLIERLKKKPEYKGKLENKDIDKGHKRDLKKDLDRTAKKPGKRIAKDGSVYYEYRENRTDINKKNRL